MAPLISNPAILHPKAVESDDLPATATLSGEWTFNGGIDLGTSGRIDSNVADAMAASSFLLQPTVAQASGTDRYLFRLLDQAGTNVLSVLSENSIAIGPSISPGGVVNVAGDISFNTGISFLPTFTGTGTALAGGSVFSDAVVGGIYTTKAGSGNSFSDMLGLSAEVEFNTNQSTTINSAFGLQTNVYHISGSMGAYTITDAGGIRIDGVVASGKVATWPNVTSWYGVYVETAGLNTSKLTNNYGIYLEEQTTGGTINNEMFIAGAGGVWFRDQGLYVNSDADGILDLHADNSVRLNGGTTFTVATPTTTHAAGAETMIFADATSGAFDVDLPASPTTGDRYYVKKVDSSANAVTVDGNGNNVDGAANQSLASQYDSIEVCFDGTEWFII